MQRISPAIGHMKLKEIRPAHLNNFYVALSKSGLRAGAGKATAKTDLDPRIKTLCSSHKAFAELAGLSATTVDAACKGESVSEDTAKKFAAALSVPVDLKGKKVRMSASQVVMVVHCLRLQADHVLTVVLFSQIP